MHVREGVVVRVEASETEIKTADASTVVIDDDDLEKSRRIRVGKSRIGNLVIGQTFCGNGTR